MEKECIFLFCSFSDHATKGERKKETAVRGIFKFSPVGTKNNAFFTSIHEKTGDVLRGEDENARARVK